jgi:hypothetical protein
MGISAIDNLQSQTSFDITATANPNPVCVDNPTSQLGVQVNFGEDEVFTYSWTSNPPGFSSTQQNPIVSPTETTVYLVEVSYGAQVASHQVNVVVHENPLAFAGEDATICADHFFQTSPNVQNVDESLWFTGGDGIFEDQSKLVTKYFPGDSDIQNGSVALSLIGYPLSPCTVFEMDNLSVTIISLSSVVIDNGINHCNTNAIHLNPVISNFSDVTWTSSGDGYFSDSFSPETLYYPGNIDVTSEKVFITLQVNPISPCQTVIRKDVEISIQQPPQVNLHGNLFICEDGFADLTAKAVNHESLSWESSGDGYFEYLPNNRALYFPGENDVMTGIVSLYVFAHPIMPCDLMDSSAINIEIVKYQELSLGQQMMACEGVPVSLPFISATTNLNWTATGDGLFDNRGSFNTVYFPGIQDVENGGCQFIVEVFPKTPCSLVVSDTIDLVITKLPNIEVINDDLSLIFDSLPFEIQANAVNYSNLTWTTTGSGTLLYPDSINATYFPSFDDELNIIGFNLLVTPNAPCASPETNHIALMPIPQPTVIAGTDRQICRDSIFYNDLAIAGNYNSLQWSSLGDGFFDDPYLLNPIYYPGVDDIDNGYADLFLEVFPLFPFESLKDTMRLNITFCHHVLLEAGWSGLSSYLNPFNQNVEALFSPIVNDLIILKSQSGVYWPDQNVNTIDAWDKQMGYQIKLENNLLFTIHGYEESTYSLNLSSGWNLIPVLTECSVEISDLFQDSIPILLKEVAGYKIFWPAMGINTLNELQPGKAYFVLMNEDATVTYPNCSKQ